MIVSKRTEFSNCIDILSFMNLYFSWLNDMLQRQCVLTQGFSQDLRLGSPHLTHWEMGGRGGGTYDFPLLKISSLMLHGSKIAQVFTHLTATPMTLI